MVEASGDLGVTVNFYTCVTLDKIKVSSKVAMTKGERCIIPCAREDGKDDREGTGKGGEELVAEKGVAGENTFFEI